MTRDFKLSLVSLGTCYYETLDRGDPLYLAGGDEQRRRCGWTGDLRLFDRILRDLRRNAF